ncbi:MAG: TfoX/Sxy family protein [Pseudomonadota bacterium]
MSDLDAHIAAAKELLEGLEARHGPISHRKMFGGAGLYAEGAIFALIVDGELLLKADPQTAPSLAGAFAAAGAERWRYDGRNKPVAMPYWSLPGEALDDPEVACDWAARAIAAAR